MRSFIRSSRLALAATAVATLLTYGFAMTSFSVSIDEELRYLDDSPAFWIGQGRPVLALTKVLLANSLPVPFLDISLAVLLLYGAAFAWAALLVRAASEAVPRAALLLFLILFTTSPVHAYYLHFDIQNVEISLAWLWIAGAAWLTWGWAVERRGRGYLGGAFLLAFLAVGTYQSLAFALMAGLLVAQLVALLVSPPPFPPGAGRHALRRSLLLLAPGVLALSAGAILNRLLVEPGGYLEMFVRWGEDDPLRILGRIGRIVVEYAVGIGFDGGWVLLPSVAVGLVVLALVVRSCRRDGLWYRLLLLGSIFSMPFALPAVLGSDLPTRTMQGIPLAAASVWVLLVLMRAPGRWGTALLLASAGLLTVWHAGVVTRMFLAERVAFETDRVIATQVADRAAQAGWTGEPIAIVTVGTRAPSPMEQWGASETFGASFFEWDDGIRTSGFMRMLGYPFLPPGPEHRETALARSAAMPAWPAAGSVLVDDGLLVLKFSDP